MLHFIHISTSSFSCDVGRHIRGPRLLNFNNRNKNKVPRLTWDYPVIPGEIGDYPITSGETGYLDQVL
jgi:hypothetical protein